ncbi:hypothetical protein AGMMS49975_30120 [Clostridia bacterium]|nr:hypothetical protein AGMMS49975_30120 [Clostridia bacterium]
MSLTIECFGHFAIKKDGEYIILKTKKARELLAMLLMERGKPIRKQVLAAKLWQYKEPKRALDSFYKVFNKLVDIEEQFNIGLTLKSQSNCVFLDISNISADIFIFEKLFETGDIEAYSKAAELYTAPFLQNDSWDWAEAQAAYYDARYLKIIDALIQFYKPIDPKMVSYYNRVKYRI